MIEIYYYSGTGYTLKAARMLKENIQEEVRLIPIIAAIKENKMHSHAKKIGLLMPMHAFGIPNAFIQFLKDFRCPNADYIFSLVTRGGAPTNMHKEIDSYLKRQNKSLCTFGYATTYNTFDTVHVIHTDDEVAEAIKDFEKDIINFAEIINKQERRIIRGYRDKMNENLLFPLIRKISKLTGYFGLQKDFYSDDSCTGCGQCSSMCLSDKIKMVGEKPYWQQHINCQYCFACLQLCPSKAVQVKKSKTPTSDRIHDVDVRCKDITAQKRYPDCI